MFQPQREIVSPIPAPDRLTSGLINKMQYDQQMENRPPQPTQAPQTLDYPESLSNAPSDAQRNAISLIREHKPNYKGTDGDIASLYNKHGEGLLSEIRANIGKITRPVEDTVGRVLGNTNTNGATNINPIIGGYEKMHPGFDSLLENYVFPQSRAQHIPDSLAASQTAVESGWGKSPAAVNQKNLHGVMQWDDAGKRSLRSFDSASDSAKMYAETVNNILRKKGYDITKMNDDQIIEALQAGGTRYEGDNADPQKYVNEIKDMGIYKKYHK